MTEQNVFSFDEEIYKRNKKRRVLLSFGIGLFFLSLIYLSFTLFYTLAGGASPLLNPDWSSIAYLILAVLLGTVLSYFLGPDPTPRQTLRITGDLLEIEQDGKSFKIEKSRVTAIEDFTDSLNVKVGKTTYQLSKDVNNSEALISILNQWTLINNRNLRRWIIIFASLLGTMLLCFTSYYFTLYLIYWPIIIIAILFGGFTVYILYRDWTKPPFINSDKQTIKKQLIIILGLMSAGIILVLILALYIFISFR